MSDAMATAELCDELSIPRPARTRIKPRNFHGIFGNKQHLELTAKLPEVDEGQYKLHFVGSQRHELRCPRCGTKHRNPELILLYRNCHHCLAVLREPKDIDIRKDQMFRLHILAASYGHRTNAKLAVDVTRGLQEAVKKVAHTKLTIKIDEDLRELLKIQDPCPRERKVLRIRYVIHGRRGEVCVDEGDFPFHLKSEFNLLAGKAMPLMSIVSAWYGHPRGVVDGKNYGAFDVTEILQSRVDSTNGRYCMISHREDLVKMFGEPCQGRSKQLVIEYEIAGKHGELYEYEIGGRLAKEISLAAAPSLAPQILIHQATYGWTAAALSEHKKRVRKKLFDLQSLEERKRMGLPLTFDETRRLRTELPQVQDQMRTLEEDVELGHVDVTEILQRRIELADGNLLFVGGTDSSKPDWVKVALMGKQCVGLDVDCADDLNNLFGNPLPGLPMKLLRISYEIIGHDADRRTCAPETTTTGIETNFVRTKPRLVLDALAYEDPRGRATITDSVIVGIPTTLPCVEINYASWGNAADSTQVWDVTDIVKKITNAHGGRRITIPAGADLVRIFGDPCLGTRKKLLIKYTARGFRGRCRIDENPLNHLRTNLVLGFSTEKTDPFNPVPRRPYRDVAIERSMRLRMSPDAIQALPEQSPYSHLGAF